MNLRPVLLLALLAAAAAVAADSSSPSRSRRSGGANGSAPPPADVNLLSFDAFRPIGDRNIFNSTRTGRPQREERGPRTDMIALVGTMDYEKGLFAFFDGSDSSYRKALRVGDTIAQFKITKIAANGVELERDGKPIPMQLAQQLRRPEGGDWTLIGLDIVRAEAQAAQAADAARAAAASAPPPIPANADPVLRRLMEQRQAQLKQ